MEFVKVPNYPVQPMPMPTPMPMPMPTPMPAPAPIMQQPMHDIHLHASYQQTEFVFPKPVHTHAVACPPKNNSAASILVLFILLVIITRSICRY
jgi:hypothetical protein